MDNTIWIHKYRPIHIDDLMINRSKILQIHSWLETFNTNDDNDNNNNNGSIIINGPHGVGKNVAIETILRNLHFEYKILNSKNTKSKKIIYDILDSYNNHSNILHIITNKTDKIKHALIIDDTETISLTGEKDNLIELCKLNDKNKILPIIFISNNQHSKLI